MAQFGHSVAYTILLSPKVGFKVVDLACFVFLVHVFSFSGLFKLVCQHCLLLTFLFFLLVTWIHLQKLYPLKKKKVK